MESLIDEVVKVLGAVLASALVAVLVQAARKMGIALDAERQAQLEYVARQAVLKVEEQAAAAAKSRLVKWDGAAKFEAAVTDVLAKVPRVDRQEAEAIVAAVLPQVGIGAAAGARELGKALWSRK